MASYSFDNPWLIPWADIQTGPLHPPEHEIPDCICGASEEDCPGDCYEYSLTKHPHWSNCEPFDG